MSEDDESPSILETFGTVPDELVELWTAKKLDECVRWCKRILRDDPVNCIALMYLGEITYDRNEYDVSLDYFTRITLHEPRFYLAWMKIGQIYLRKKEYRSAQKSLMAGVKFGSPVAFMWALLALAYYVDEKRDLAYLALKAGEAQAEEKSTVLFTRGLFHEQDGDLDDAALAYTASDAHADREGKSEEDREVARKALKALLTKG